MQHLLLHLTWIIRAWEIVGNTNEWKFYECERRLSEIHECESCHSLWGFNKEVNCEEVTKLVSENYLE